MESWHLLRSVRVKKSILTKHKIASFGSGDAYPEEPPERPWRCIWCGAIKECPNAWCTRCNKQTGGTNLHPREKSSIYVEDC